MMAVRLSKERRLAAPMASSRTSWLTTTWRRCGRLLHDLYGVNTVMLQLYPRSPTSFEPPVFMSTVPLLSQNFFCDCGVNKHRCPR